MTIEWGNEINVHFEFRGKINQGLQCGKMGSKTSRDKLEIYVLKNCDRDVTIFMVQ